MVSHKGLCRQLHLKYDMNLLNCLIIFYMNNIKATEYFDIESIKFSSEIIEEEIYDKAH